MKTSGKFQLAPLPYDYNALEPAISAETLRYHHDQHHQGYVNKLNELLSGSGMENLELTEIIRRAQGPLFNNAGQTWNHDFYWKSMSPANKPTKPSSDLSSALEKKYGTVDQFKAEFEKQAAAIFGSGWAWLVLDQKGDIQILQTKDADNPIRQNLYPLFTCDVWEHAYYIDYRNLRAKYLSRFWDVMNWDFALKNFLQARDFISKGAKGPIQPPEAA